MVIENSPLSSAVSVAITVEPPINKLTVLPASATPSISGVESSVSDVVVVIDGSLGAIVSTVNENTEDSEDVLPAPSLAVNVKS